MGMLGWENSTRKLDVTAVEVVHGNIFFICDITELCMLRVSWNQRLTEPDAVLRGGYIVAKQFLLSDGLRHVSGNMDESSDNILRANLHGLVHDKRAHGIETLGKELDEMRMGSQQTLRGDI